MSDLLSTIAQGGGYNPLALAGQVMQYKTAQQQLLNQQQQLQANQFALSQAKLQPAYAGIMALNPDTATWGDVHQALAQSERLNGDISGLTANMNEMMANNGKPGDYVRSVRLRGMPPFEQFGVSNLTAEQLAQQINWNDPVTGEPKSTTLGEALRSGYGSGTIGGGGAASGTGAPATPTPPAADKQAFVQSFGPTAQRISKATGLPVNYVMAQAGLETGWGTSGHYRNNNFFGISPGGTVASYPTPDAGADAYINLVNNDPRYASLPRTGTPQEIGDRFAAAGYNPAVAGGPGGPSYGARIQSFAAGLPEPGSYQVASTAPVGPPSGAPATPAAPTPPMGGGANPFQGGVLTGGQSPYMRFAFEQGAKDYNAAMGDNAQLQGRISPLLNTLSILHEHPTLQTGPGQENLNSWIQWGRSMGLDVSGMVGANGDNVTAWQELKKFLLQYDQGIPGAQRSDLAALNAQASNPNTEQGRNAIAILAGKAIGNEMVKVARFRQFNAQNPGTGPNGWSMAATRSQFFNLETTDWGGKQDPMAYAAAVGAVPPDAVGQYMRGLPSPQLKQNFVQSLRSAQQLFPEMAAPPPTAGGQ